MKLRANYIQLLNLQLFNNIFISQNIFKIAVVYLRPETEKDSQAKCLAVR